MRRGQVSPTDKLLKRPARRPGAEEKAFCPCLLSYYRRQNILAIDSTFYRFIKIDEPVKSRTDG